MKGKRIPDQHYPHTGDAMHCCSILLTIYVTGFLFCLTQINTNYRFNTGKKKASKCKYFGEGGDAIRRCKHWTCSRQVERRYSVFTEHPASRPAGRAALLAAPPSRVTRPTSAERSNSDGVIDSKRRRRQIAFANE